MKTKFWVYYLVKDIIMLFKSKWFWISAVLSICAVIFFALVHHQAKQPQKVIKVYKAVGPAPRKTPQPPADATVTGQTRHDTDPEMDTTDMPLADFSEDASHRTDGFTHTRDDFYDEPNHPDAADAPADDLNTDVAAEAEAAYVAQQVSELRIEISQALQERLDLFDQIFALADFGMEDEEPYALRQQLQKEAGELRKTIFNLCGEYIDYTMDDSPFQPGGEFYDLMEQNYIGISLEEVSLEEVKELP